MKTIINTLILVSILFAFPANAQKLVLSTLDVDTVIIPVCQRILEVAYSRIGITLKVKKFPSERAFYMSNSGKTDGELFRIAGIDKRFVNLIPVNVPVHVMRGMVVSKKVDFKVNGRESLKPYKIAVMRRF